jgi:beta-glucosidase
MKRWIVKTLVLSCVVIFSSCAKKTDIEKRAEQLLSAMTLEEKAGMLSGTGFDSKPVPRLGIPAMKMSDGPLGVRRGKATAFPAGVAMAASWNPDLVAEVGGAIGRETRAKGLNVLLGPCVNIHRVPMGGRNFESFGEDPYLAARTAVAYIQGMQAEKVIATVKHFAVNNQETDRFTVNAKADERTLREIYLPAFKAAVQEAGAWAVMGAYNRLNGPYCCANPWLLDQVLKKEWGFKGLVMSDWGAVHDVDSTLVGGLDIEMPGEEHLTKDSVLSAVQTGNVDEKTIDDKVRRMLRTMLAAGLFDSSATPPAAVDTADQRKVALKAAWESIVLLKNEGGFLPLDRTKIKTLAVIGPNAGRAITGGGGSSQVDPYASISALEGLKKKLGETVEIRYARGIPEDMDLAPVDSLHLAPPGAKPGRHGLMAEYFSNPDRRGKPALKRVDPKIDFDWGDEAPDPVLPKDNFSVRWTGSLVPSETGVYTLGIGSDDGSRLYLDGKLLIDHWGQHNLTYKTAVVPLTAGRAYPIRIEMYEGPGGAGAVLSWNNASMKKTDPLTDAVEAARTSDAVLVFAGSTAREESEGFDRPALGLSESQEQLIRSVADANPNTAVALYSGAAVVMDSWLDRVKGLVEVWFPGQEGGEAIADVLFGDVNPSGKLPTTFMKRWEDCPAFGNFPGAGGSVDYTEGIFVGYRYFDAKNVEPLFPFGFGLSYTTFEYSDLQVAPAKVRPDGKIGIRLMVRNTGKVAGAEVVQVYIADEKASVPRPPKELKAFKKVFVAPGEKRAVSFLLDQSALSFYDVNAKDWVAEPGKFNVLVGSSSRDIRLRGAFELE